MVRLQGNYQAKLLNGNDSKMNGRLISEGAGRKSLRTVDFRAARWRPASGRVHASLCRVLKHTLEPPWLGGVLPSEGSQTSILQLTT